MTKELINNYELLFKIGELGDKVSQAFEGEDLELCATTLMFLLAASCEFRDGTIDGLCEEIRGVHKQYLKLKNINDMIEKTMKENQEEI